jgi:hypothetical protein
LIRQARRKQTKAVSAKRRKRGGKKRRKEKEPLCSWGDDGLRALIYAALYAVADGVELLL